jgi:hypothetical protein
MRQGTFGKEIFIRSDPATVISAIADSLQWGPSKFRGKHRAYITAVTNDTIHTETYQSPATTVTNVTKLTPRDDGVLVHETITLRAPDMLFIYAFQQASAAHEEMLQRIKKFVETK